MDASLIGREFDLARCADFLAEVSSVGGALVVLGDPGVGKTALLTQAARSAKDAGMSVLRAAGTQYRAEAGYGALRRLLASTPLTGAAHSPALAAALSATGVSTAAPVVNASRDGGRGHESVADAVVSLMVGLGDRRAALLVVDDAQWLDAASADVLAEVARRLPGTGAGMLVAAGAGEESFFNYNGLPLHEVGPLSETASEALLIERFPALAPQVRRRLMADAEGNPLALLELPTALTDSQRTASQVMPRHLPLTQRLLAAFASRIRHLPAVTRYLLLVAALEGGGNLRVVLQAAADRGDLRHWAPAERGGLVRIDESTGRLEFRHPLMRSAVVELSTSEQRRGAHRALAEASVGIPDQRVRHLAQAAVDPDEEVATLLEEAAGRSAARGDGPGAVAGLVRAADLSPRAAARARRLAKAAFLGATLTGNLRDVPQLLDTARQVSPDADSLPAAVATAVHLLNGYGDIDTAHRVLTAAIGAQPRPYDPGDTTLLEALATLVMVCFYGGRAELWEAFDDALAQFTSVPEILKVTRSTFGDPARARPADWARLDAAVDAALNTANPLQVVRVGIAASYVDRLSPLEEPLRRIGYGQRAGDNVLPAIQALVLLCHQAWWAGRWDELPVLADDALTLAEVHHYSLRTWPAKYLLASVHAARGDATAARRLCDQMEQWAGSRRAHTVRLYAAHVRALVALGEGDFETAYRHVTTIAPAGSFPPFVRNALWIFLDTVEAALRSGRRDEALQHIAAARDAGLDHASARLAFLLRGADALLAGGAQDAEPLFEAALSTEGSERWPFDRARLHLCYGERLRRGRTPARAKARGHLERAAEIFTQLGAVPWADRAAKELRACGGPARRSNTTSGPTALTPQQWEIASLAAAGLTNKQIAEKLFLSPRTVSTHLYQVFPKLGITSRAALRDALDSLGRL
ncbi:helix-turn-helix transcriptional regulator [Actinomadura decatromicini]|uniref:AAA family ATPase n=1 Tax=Actinomadura decatromicini TaxID=2604572 RepID=A0A5D3FYM3_9ACTN|nr:LuxR family transcriptional regulator [Actinomadura decatromicini]TYK53026.1 AAA family ATPase [Actinomadura decatromicini]